MEKRRLSRWMSEGKGWKGIFHPFRLQESPNCRIFAATKNRTKYMKRKSIGIIVAMLVLAVAGGTAWSLRDMPQKRLLQKDIELSLIVIKKDVNLSLIYIYI